MQALGQHPLAGADLAGQQYRHGILGDLPRFFQYFLHGGILHRQAVEPGAGHKAAAVEFPPQFAADLGDAPPFLEG